MLLVVRMQSAHLLCAYWDTWTQERPKYWTRFVIHNLCTSFHTKLAPPTLTLQIRHTNVQDGEAGGITQQIGATFVPDTAIREQTKFLKEVCGLLFVVCEYRVKFYFKIL